MFVPFGPSLIQGGAYADAWVGQKIQPFWIEEEARKIKDTNLDTSGNWPLSGVCAGKALRVHWISRFRG
jgi:hypothetical protein